MTLEGYNQLCSGFLATNHVVQWGGSDVWKVVDKVFAIGRVDEGQFQVSFKVSELSFALLKDQPGLRPAPYLASRGFSWIQHFADPGLDDAALEDYLRQSHHLVALGLSKKKRSAHGLIIP